MAAPEIGATGGDTFQVKDTDLAAATSPNRLFIECENL